jgi:hypothetical protein
MTDEEIHNIYLHMSGKAEGLVEGTGTADFPVLFARAIIEYEEMTKDVQNMASKSTYKEQLETKDEPVSCAECGADGGHALYCVACAEKFIAQTETKDEPVAIVISESGANVTHSWWHEPALPIGTKLYTSPQRTWVGLTDEEIDQGLLRSNHALQTAGAWREGVEWATEHLKEKNT